MIENTILENKHYLAQLLQNADSLRKKAECDAYDDKISEKQLNEVINIWNCTFAELIREGLAYDFIKMTDPSKNIVRLTIDNVQYDCLAKDLKKIFKEEYKTLINDEFAISVEDNDISIEIGKPEKLSRKEKKEEKELKETLLKVITDKNKEDIENNKNDVNEFEKDTKNEIINAITQIDKNNNDLDKEQDLNVYFVEDNIPMETKTAIKYEKVKAANTFIYDVYDLTLIPQGGITGEKIKAIIAPLRYEDNNSHPDIMAMLVDIRGQIATFVSKNGLASLKIKFNENEFLLRGTLSNGKFQSHIVPAGATMAMGFNLNKNTIIEKRSVKKEFTNYGHIAFEKFGYIYHIVPTATTNDENGIAPCLICVEKINDINNRTVLTTNNRGFTVFTTPNGEQYQILTYWQDNLLCAEVLQA